MTPPPVILIGAARSGTKILRDILGTPAGVATVPYDVNYVWRYGAGEVPDDVLDPNSLTERRCSFIRATLPRLAGSRAGDVMVEKTVSNTLRVPFVDRVFPDARFVHLIRDGRDVTESAMRQWQAGPDWPALWKKLRGMPWSNSGYAMWFAGNMMRGLARGRGGGSVWGPRFAGIDEAVQKSSLAAVCARQWQSSVEVAQKDLATLPAERVFEIRYEDMATDPALLGDLARQLGLPDPAAVVAAGTQRLRPTPPGAWRALPDADRRTIETLLAPTLTTLGYPR